jgi:hypothetical protein
MDNSVITAVAAFASWLSQRVQARTQWIAHYQALRGDLYREFIEQSSKLCIHALQNSNADVVALMGIYADLNRMRIVSSAAPTGCSRKSAIAIWSRTRSFLSCGR